jgi:hypothetical protein
MEIRDLIGMAFAVFLTSAVAIATVENPPGYLRAAVFVSVALLAVLATIEAAGRPWFTGDVTAIAKNGSETVLQVALRNHGTRQTGERIFNVLVPDNLNVQECDRHGVPRADARQILHTPESTDGIHESDYWQTGMVMPPGTKIVYLLIDGLPAAGTFLRLTWAGERRDVFLPEGSLNVPRTVNWAPIRAWAKTKWQDWRRRRGK